MDTAIRDHVIRSLRESAEVRQAVIDYCTDSIVAAGSAIHHALEQGGKLILLGNGGSAADAQHISAEFTGRFMKDRAPLAAIALTTDTSALTAIGNDYGYDQVFTRQIQALGRPNDVVLAISTSGRYPNCRSKSRPSSRPRGERIAAIAGPVRGSRGGFLLG